MLTSDIIHGFVQSCLQRKFDQPVATPDCHMEWWDICCSEANNIAIAAPRKHAKSTAITFSYILAAAMFRESQFIIICSDTEGQSSLFLGDIRQELLENEDLIALFGVDKFIKLSETDIIVQMDDGYQFRIMAKGAEQKLRGLKWQGKRPDLLVCDDMENDEAVSNADRREKFRRWFYGALLPCRANGGKAIIVGTILHMDSLLERIMPDYKGSKSVLEPLKLYSKDTSTYWKAVKYKAHTEDFSHILWQEQWPKDKLIAERQGFLEQGLQDVYSREFLNYPIDESTAYFRREDFITMEESDFEAKVQYYSAIDFAISQNERADYTVIATVGVDTSGELLVTDIRRGRWDSFQIAEEMISVQRRFKPELFIAESGAIEKAIGPYLRKVMNERRVYINLRLEKPVKDKMSRARSLQARMRAGGIRFDKGASWYLGLEDEMARFPKDRHDDQVDALAWIGLVLDLIEETPTYEEDAEEEWRRESQEFNFSGRHSQTGY